MRSVHMKVFYPLERSLLEILKTVSSEPKISIDAHAMGSAANNR
jgi:hypothetical protein